MGLFGYHHTEDAKRKISEASRLPRIHKLKDLHVEFDKRWIPVTESGCWIWIGNTMNKGYGIFSLGLRSKSILAHRFAFERWNGFIPDGLLVCHRCDVPCCVNPHHLFAGTYSDNMQDCWNKGRGYLVGGATGEAHPFATVTWNDVRKIRTLYQDGRLIKESGKYSGRELAVMFKTTYAAVIQIVGGTTWCER